MAKLLTGLGLDVGHECEGRDGVVSCFFSVDDYWYPWGRHSTRLGQWEFDTTIHVVRHPLGVIGSMASPPFCDKRAWWHWQEKHTGVSWETEPVARSAQFWLKWTALSRLQAANEVCIERAREMWPQTLPPLSDEAIPHAGASAHRELGWEDLGEWAEPVAKRAAEYGYA